MTRSLGLRRACLAVSLVLSACSSETPSEPPLSDPRGLILLGTVAFPGELFVMRPDGSGLRQLTNDTIRDEGGDWSPDGRSIVFTRWQDRVPGPLMYRPDIFTMNADGSGKRRLHVASGMASGPRWSPDGRRIAFAQGCCLLGYFVDTTTRVHVMNADGSGVQVVTPQGGSFAPDWSPDGTRLLFLARRPERPAQSMYTIRLDGSDERLVGGDVACVTDVHQATWSPDGSRIAYRCSDPPDYVIQSIAADGTSPVRLSLVESGLRPLMFHTSPVWSPDGAQIAFGSSRGNTTEPFVMDATGTNVVPIGGALHRGLIPVAWGPAPR